MLDVSRSDHYTGDCRALLEQLPEASVQTCVTSPPYWSLRSYDMDGQIGLEATPEEYVAALVDVFRGVRRGLRDDGTLWLNLGDTFAGSGRGGYAGGKTRLEGSTAGQDAAREAIANVQRAAGSVRRTAGLPGLKPKDVIGLPWMVAFALRADGWHLRADIIWAKPNPMPDPVKDRPTKAHEYLFLLAKSASYFYDAAAIAEPCVSTSASGNRTRKCRGPDDGGIDDPTKRLPYGVPWSDVGGTRNARSVWTFPTQPYDGDHFAVMPPRLAERCILAGSRPGDIVLDPFHGSGTTGMVAEKHGRRWIGFDLNPAYADLAAERTAQRSLAMGVE